MATKADIETSEADITKEAIGTKVITIAVIVETETTTTTMTTTITATVMTAIITIPAVITHPR